METSEVTGIEDATFGAQGIAWEEEVVVFLRGSAGHIGYYGLFVRLFLFV